MAFERFTVRLRAVAEASVDHARSRYGKNGFKIDEPIPGENISWKPTFLHKPTTSGILAYEVDEILFPAALKIAAHDIRNAGTPISVYQVCPLDVCLADPRQETVKQLHANGFGLITVDDHGGVTEQKSCCPLAQHIAPTELETEIKNLLPSTKVLFRNAHLTYIANAGQGLQMCGQLVEGMVNELAEASEARGWVPAGTYAGKMAADTIDILYGLNAFANHRAALGGARDFVREYRNVASHAPKSAQQAIRKLRKCRDGFMDSIRICENLGAAGKALSIKMRLHITA